MLELFGFKPVEFVHYHIHKDSNVLWGVSSTAQDIMEGNDQYHIKEPKTLCH